MCAFLAPDSLDNGGDVGLACQLDQKQSQMLLQRPARERARTYLLDVVSDRRRQLDGSPYGAQPIVRLPDGVW